MVEYVYLVTMLAIVNVARSLNESRINLGALGSIPHLHHPQLPPRPHQIGLKVEWSSALAGLDEVAHAGAFGAHVFAVLLVDLGFKRDPFHDLQPIATQPRNLVGVIGG